MFLYLRYQYGKQYHLNKKEIAIQNVLESSSTEKIISIKILV